LVSIADTDVTARLRLLRVIRDLAGTEQSDADLPRQSIDNRLYTGGGLE
jgi:hypothetical protein